MIISVSSKHVLLHYTMLLSLLVEYMIKFKKVQSYYLSELTFYMILACDARYGWYDSWNNGFLGLAFSTRPTFRLSFCGFSVLSMFSRFEKIHLWVYQSGLGEKVRYLLGINIAICWTSRVFTQTTDRKTVSRPKHIFKTWDFFPSVLNYF